MKFHYITFLIIPLLLHYYAWTLDRKHQLQGIARRPNTAYSQYFDLYSKNYLSKPKSNESSICKKLPSNNQIDSVKIDKTIFQKKFSEEPVISKSNVKNTTEKSPLPNSSLLVTLPNEETLKERLQCVRYFAEKTDLPGKLANQVKNPLGVVIAVDLALSDFGGGEIMQLWRPIIISKILKDYPEIVQDLEKQGIISFD